MRKAHRVLISIALLLLATSAAFPPYSPNVKAGNDMSRGFFLSGSFDSRNTEISWGHLLLEVAIIVCAGASVAIAFPLRKREGRE